MSLAEKLFAKIGEVRYVALEAGGNVTLHERPEISNASESDSDQYEELLVNPTVLEITRRRGDIDCGGLHFVLIRYGNFFQYVSPTETGHLSIAIEPDANLDATIQEIQSIIGAG